jgi:hypothetical protein
MCPLVVDLKKKCIGVCTFTIPANSRMQFRASIRVTLIRGSVTPESESMRRRYLTTNFPSFKKSREFFPRSLLQFQTLRIDSMRFNDKNFLLYSVTGNGTIFRTKHTLYFYHTWGKSVHNIN